MLKKERVMYMSGRLFVGSVIGTIIVIVLLTLTFMADDKETAAELQSFKADLVAVGFKTNYTPRTEYDRKREGHENTYNAIVVVDNCNVELVRNANETHVARRVGGRDIEDYRLARVNIDSAIGRPTKIYDDSTVAPTPDNIRTFLAGNGGKARFPCFSPRSN